MSCIDLAEFLASKQEAVPHAYEGAVEKDLYANFEPVAFKLRSDDKVVEFFDYPVSEDLVLSIRRSAEQEDLTLRR